MDGPPSYGMGVSFQYPMGMGMGMSVIFKNGCGCRYSSTHPEPASLPFLNVGEMEREG